MGGCYSYDYRSREPKKTQAKLEKISAKGVVTKLINAFWKTGERENLIKAQVAFASSNKSGFFLRLADSQGIKNAADIPKEFPETEYEVKFDVEPVEGNDSEPGIADYLNAFDFPAVATARFLKDPVNITATGVNNFYGNNGEERLVVIEKGGNLYLKEKGPAAPLETNVEFQEVVIKRTETRYPASFSEVQEKIKEVTEEGAEYKGKIRKEKGDAFLLDTSDGRLYSMSFTRAHLIKPGEKNESGIQRQLELEYAGYIPKFPGFKLNSEEQIVEGMVDLAKYTGVMYSNAPVKNGWRANLKLTGERKYDFITGNKASLERTLQPVLLLPESMPVYIGEEQ